MCLSVFVRVCVCVVNHLGPSAFRVLGVLLVLVARQCQVLPFPHPVGLGLEVVAYPEPACDLKQHHLVARPSKPHVCTVAGCRAPAGRVQALRAGGPESLGAGQGLAPGSWGLLMMFCS